MTLWISKPMPFLDSRLDWKRMVWFHTTTNLGLLDIWSYTDSWNLMYMCMKGASEGGRKRSGITGCWKRARRWWLNDIQRWKQKDFRANEIKKRFKCPLVGVEKRLIGLLHNINAALWCFGTAVCKRLFSGTGWSPLFKETFSSSTEVGLKRTQLWCQGESGLLWGKDRNKLVWGTRGGDKREQLRRQKGWLKGTRSNLPTEIDNGSPVPVCLWKVAAQRQFIDQWGLKVASFSFTMKEPDVKAWEFLPSLW